MVGWLADDFQVRVGATGSEPLPGAVRTPLPAARGPRLLRQLRHAVALKLRRFDPKLWPPGLREFATREAACGPAFIAVHDLTLLPLALAIRDATRAAPAPRVFFDAREYYPRHFEDRWLWRFLYRDLNRHLCSVHLPRADLVATVSPALADAYRADYGIACGVLPSFPAPVPLAPTPVDPATIRLVHHGFAAPSRRLESMLEVMRHVGPRFHLDLMLVGEDRRYLARLRAAARDLPRVRFLPPVPFAQLILETNRYDIGMFLVPPVNFNLRHTLPNKFFEFVQARLMVAIGPSEQMARYVRTHDLGLVADDFAPRTLAAALDRLTPERIAACKQNAHRAAALLNSEALRGPIRHIATGRAGLEVLP